MAPVRIVGGELGGRRLRVPRDRSIRPTSDRVRESLFGALGSLGLIEGARVLDGFAGTGALGIEALSRGAAHVTFVDSSPHAIGIVKANLAELDVVGRATVVRARLETWLRAQAPGTGFDLALLDPPYRDTDWHDLLALSPGVTVVIESDRAVELPPHYRLVRDRRYGSTHLRIAVLAP